MYVSSYTPDLREPDLLENRPVSLDTRQRESIFEEFFDTWQKLHATHAYRQKKVSVYISEVSIFHVEEKMSLYAHVKGHLTKEGDLYTAHAGGESQGQGKVSCYIRA